MRKFQLFVTDERYPAPLLYVVEASNAARATELARRLLGENPHHRSVELFDRGAHICKLNAEDTQGHPVDIAAPDTVEEYLAQAHAADEFAARETDPETRNLYRDIANQWRRLAAELPRNRPSSGND